VTDTADVDELTVRLYTTPPEDFVKVRADGVKQLKAAEQDETAAAFGKLAKPSMPAWAINVLVARRPDVIDDIVERGDELRRAHTGGGGAKEIRAAQQARQESIRAATDIAAELAQRRLSEAHRAEIAATLEAASSDAAAAEEVRRGHLARPLDAPTGFDLFGGLTVITGGRTGRPRRGSSPVSAAASASDADADEQAHHARATMLRSEAESALSAAEQAGETAAALRDRVSALEEQRTAAEQELRRLDGELTSARRDAREAERAASAAARKAARAATRAERTEP
jgi:hypothetical protein